MQRLLKDYQELSNIYTVYPIKDSIDNFYIIIKGNDNSPYENIPFIFVFNVTNEYPFKPPNVKYISFTNANIHPNLYTNGKVCLTTLGTYIGPDSSNLNKTCGWTPVMTLLSVARSIQSILHETPLLQEPCLVGEITNHRIQAYNDRVKKECMDSLQNYKSLNLPLFIKHKIDEIVNA